MLCVLYSKDKRQKLGQSGQRSKDKVQKREEKYIKNPRRWHGFSCLCVLSKDKTAKCRTFKRKKEVRKKNKEGKRNWLKKKPPSFVFVVCCVGRRLCDELITRLEEPNRVFVRVSYCV